MKTTDFFDLSERELQELSMHFDINYNLLNGKETHSKAISLCDYIKNSNNEEKAKEYLDFIKSRKTNLIDMNKKKGIKIFISHSSKDKDLARAVVEAIEDAYKIPSECILCTSIEGHKLNAGDKVTDKLQKEVLSADLVIGLITPNALNSVFTMFELGARWGAEKPFMPITYDKNISDSLPEPIKSYIISDVSENNSAQQFIESIAKHIEGYPQESYSVYRQKVNNIVRIATRLKLKSETIVNRKCDVNGLRKIVVTHRELDSISLLASAKKEVIFHASIYPSYARDGNYQRAIQDLIEKNPEINMSFIITDTRQKWAKEFAKVLRPQWDIKSFKREAKDNVSFFKKPLADSQSKPANLFIYITSRIPLVPMIIVDNDILLGHYCHSTGIAPNGLWIQLHCEKISRLLKIYRCYGKNSDKYKNYIKQMNVEERAIIRYVEEALDAMENSREIGGDPPNNK